MSFIERSIAFEADVVQVLPSENERVIGLLLHKDADAQLMVWFPDHGPEAVTMLTFSGLLARRCQWVHLNDTHSVGIVRELAAKPYPETAALHAFDLSTGLPLWSLPGVDVLTTSDTEGYLSIVPAQEPEAEPVWVRIQDGEAVLWPSSDHITEPNGLRQASRFSTGQAYYAEIEKYCHDMGIPILDRVLYTEWQAGIIIGTIQQHTPKLYYVAHPAQPELVWTASGQSVSEDAQNLHAQETVWSMFSVAVGRCLYLIWQNELLVFSAS